MKRFLLSTLFLALSAGAFAQVEIIEETVQNRRGPYLTNRFFDNWFLSAAGGVQVYWGENDSYGSFGKRLSPALDVSLGKWITPSVGLRIQYSGLQARGWGLGQTPYARSYAGEGMYKERFSIASLHGDVLWNISNALGGFREDRTWSFVPFAGFGGIRSWANDTHKNELAMTLGLLNNIRLSPSVDLNLEVKMAIFNQALDKVSRGSSFEGLTTATFGVTYKFGRRGFSRPAAVREAVAVDVSGYTNRIQALQDELAASKRKNQDLNAALDAARNRKPEVVTNVVAAPMAVFFTIGQATLTEKEMINLKYQAEVIKKDLNKKYKLIGSADKATGSAARNQQLSQERAQAVYDLLVKKYGVDPKQLEIVANGDRDEPFGQPVLNRVVIVE